MGRILGAYLMPHPPIILPEIGKGEERKVQKTEESMQKIAKEIKEKSPQLIIIVTPHGPLFSDAIAILYKSVLKGDLGRFDCKEIKFIKDSDIELVNDISRRAGEKGIMCALVDEDMAKQYKISSKLDHGAMVPLYFIEKEYREYKLIHITYGLLAREDLYQFGKIIQDAIENHSENAVIIASGDLSHRLTAGAPAGYSSKGKEFDGLLLQLLEHGDIEGILALDHTFAEEAGECGLRSIDVMLGACDGYDIKSHVLSYEGPFGVGYGVVKIDMENKNFRKSSVEKLYQNRAHRIRQIRGNEDQYVALARRALESYVESGEVVMEGNGIIKELKEQKAGVFVSIKKHGQLRGCIGTIHPTESCVMKEIIRNAIQAGTQDPRFFPVEEDELEELTYSVDVLKEPEPIQSIDELDEKRYGVIVTSGRRSGLLLPNLENVNSVEEQVMIAKQKAGIKEGEAFKLQRFEVIRHK